MAGTKTKPRGWPIGAFLLLVAGLLAMAWGRLGPGAPAGSAAGATIVVRYEGHNWIPVDPPRPVAFPDDQMVMLGLDGRQTLWANRAAGLGGGGGAGAPTGLKVGAYHRIYVRLDDGRYLPMMWLSAAPDRQR